MTKISIEVPDEECIRCPYSIKTEGSNGVERITFYLCMIFEKVLKFRKNKYGYTVGVGRCKECNAAEIKEVQYGEDKEIHSQPKAVSEYSQDGPLPNDTMG